MNLRPISQVFDYHQTFTSTVVVLPSNIYLDVTWQRAARKNVMSPVLKQLFKILGCLNKLMDHSGIHRRMPTAGYDPQL